MLRNVLQRFMKWPKQEREKNPQNCNPVAAAVLCGKGSGLDPILVVINMDTPLKHSVPCDCRGELAKLASLSQIKPIGASLLHRE